MLVFAPLLPRMIRERVFSIRREIFRQLQPFLLGETGANTDVMQRPDVTVTVARSTSALTVTDASGRLLSLTIQTQMVLS